MGHRQKKIRVHWLLRPTRLRFFLFLIILLVSGNVEAGDKITIGEVEEVILMPWGVKLPARIDTGAEMSSLDARELKVKNNIAEFRLPNRFGGLELRLPVKTWQHFRSADFKEKRPIVEITFCMGPKLLHVNVNLNDRSTVRYPLILGRNALKDHFIVDCEQTHCLPPSCPEAKPK